MGKPMTKGGLALALSEETELKKSDCMKVINSLAGVATKEVKSAGKFVIPGLCMVKTRVKPATKAGKREVFGKVMMVKAKPAKTIVKAYPVSALKKSIRVQSPAFLAARSPWAPRGQSPGSGKSRL